MASSSSGPCGLRTKAPPPARSDWLRQMAERVDKKERRGEVTGPERFPLREGRHLRRLLAEDSHDFAASLLEVGPGISISAIVQPEDFPDLTVSLAKHQRERLALKPARFEPQEGTRIIEGRPVQALPRASLQACPTVWKRRCGRVWRAGGAGGVSARGTWAGSACGLLCLMARDIRWPSPSPATCVPPQCSTEPLAGRFLVSLRRPIARRWSFLTRMRRLRAQCHTWRLACGRCR